MSGLLDAGVVAFVVKRSREVDECAAGPRNIWGSSPDTLFTGYNSPRARIPAFKWQPLGNCA